jgi:hypothetical protein
VLFGILGATFAPYVVAVILFVAALWPGHGNRVLIRLAVAVFVLGLLAGAVLRPAVVLMTGGWGSLSRVARMTVVGGFVLRTIGAIALLVIGFRV